jgi:hypothetical protein
MFGANLRSKNAEQELAAEAEACPDDGRSAYVSMVAPPPSRMTADIRWLPPLLQTHFPGCRHA